MMLFCATIVAVEKHEVLCSLRMFVALGMQRAMRMPHIVMCDLSGSTVFFHIISLTVWFSKKKESY
jgi:hypothetical protein